MKVEGDLQRVVDQRVARLLVATGKSDEAIVAGQRHRQQQPEIHGDALMAQGKRDEARAQYEKALKTLDVAAPRQRLLETKVMDAGGTVAAPAESV